MNESVCVFEPPKSATVPVAGQEARFPVRRIYCVGRNYADHAVEMGHSGREPPFFFLKPGDTVLGVEQGSVGRVPYPADTESLHHEVELVLAIGRAGRDIALADAPGHIWGYGVGLDMTRRDVQAQAKKQGRPWCASKAFEQSAPMGALVAAADCHWDAGSVIELSVNGAVTQRGRLGDMIWSPQEILCEISRIWQLEPGDLVFTGTPAGVGPVSRGDVLAARVDGVGGFELRVE